MRQKFNTSLRVFLLTSVVLSTHANALSNIILTQGRGTEVEGSSQFGYSTSTGDFNKDGYIDVAIGAPYNDTGSGSNSGWVEIYWGGRSGPGNHGSEYFTQNSIAGVSREAGDRLGYAMAGGDFDRDGFADLAVSMPYRDVNGLADTGMVAIMYGSTTGLIPPRSEVIVQGDSEFASSEANDQFGYSLVSGDFDNDGYDDLAVGSPFEDVEGLTNTGSITIFYGGSQGVRANSPTENITEKSINGLTRAAGDLFGLKLAVGDFNTDGRDDLAVSAQSYDDQGITDSGVVVVLHGSNKGLLPANSMVIRAPNPQKNDLFGFSLATGNMNGDIYSDLAIGSPDRDVNGVNNAGRVLVYRGSNNGLGNRTIFDESNIGATVTENNLFGAAITLSDFDDDGFDDLAIGIPYDDSNLVNTAGAVGFIYGDANLNNTLRATKETQNSLLDSTSADRASDHFGMKLTSADVNKDGRSELIMGIPFKDVNSNLNAGQVVVHTPPAAVSAGTSQAAIVIDRATGNIIAGYNMRQRRAMASTTKIMTALLTYEAIDNGVITLNTPTIISANAGSQGGSTMGLQPGDRVTIADLLLGLMLPSGNDAAIALAEAIAGSEADFLVMMNDRAQELNLKHTFYSTVHGRDPHKNNSACRAELVLDNGQCSHYSTAEDMARLARVALRDNRFANLVATADQRTTNWDRPNPATPGTWISADARMCSTNRYIRRAVCGTANNDFAGTGISIFGVKTGSTGNAGNCFVGAAQDTSTGREVISVVLGSSNSATRFTDSTAVINFGFERF